MKKLSLLLLLPFFMLLSCSDSDDITPTTEPEKGDEMTIEQIVGTYVATSIKYDNGANGFFDDKIELTFNSDYTGEEWNPRTLEKSPFTWAYSDKIISFSYSLHKNVKGWFKNSELKYRDYGINNGVKDKYIATHTYMKK